MKKSKTRSKQTKSPTQPVKVTEVSVMVSKKISAHFNSCCVSYSVKASLDESNNEYLKALDDLAYRRKGLAVSAAILLCMIGLLLLKVRC